MAPHMIIFDDSSGQSTAVLMLRSPKRAGSAATFVVAHTGEMMHEYDFSVHDLDQFIDALVAFRQQHLDDQGVPCGD